MFCVLPSSTLICHLSDFSIFLLADYSNVTTAFHYERFYVEEPTCYSDMLVCCQKHNYVCINRCYILVESFVFRPAGAIRFF